VFAPLAGLAELRAASANPVRKVSKAAPQAVHPLNLQLLCTAKADLWLVFMGWISSVSFLRINAKWRNAIAI
jgi:hypothetical protein